MYPLYNVRAQCIVIYLHSRFSCCSILISNNTLPSNSYLFQELNVTKTSFTTFTKVFKNVKILKLPSSIVITGLHLSIPNVVIKHSTKIVLFSSKDIAVSNACLLYSDSSPTFDNQILHDGLVYFIFSIALWNV